MKNVWKLFEELDGYSYVTNIATNDLVFMNKKTREAFGFHNSDEYIGKKCYEVFHNRKSPCPFCNNRILELGKFTNWDHYNKRINTHVKMLDTLIEYEGIRYRFEIALDITEAKIHADHLKRLSTYEKIANEGISMALEEDTPEKALHILLKYMGTIAQADRVYVFEKNPICKRNMISEWCTPNLEQIVPSAPMTQELLEQIYQAFDTGRLSTVKSLDALQEQEPQLYDALIKMRIHSILLIPLVSKNKTIAFYSVNNPPRDSIDSIYEILRIISNFIVSVLRRRHLYEKLRLASHTDDLTGIGNRRAFYEYFQELDGRHNVGILYCDITGLKFSNDNQGHTVGDALIVRAAECLQKTFQYHEIFRIGGDEYVVLCDNISYEELQKRKDILITYLAETHTLMSIGTHWTEVFSGSDLSFLAIAEKNMYLDKDAWYKEHGITRRR